MRPLLLLVLAMLTGCAGSLTGHAPETRTLTLPGTPAHLALRVAETFAAMGGQMTAAMEGRDSTQGTRVLSGVVHGGVVVTVLLQPEGEGTRVTVTASIPPGKVVFGTLDEAEQFCTRLRTMETADVR
jgi:hypothetical protein